MSFPGFSKIQGNFLLAFIIFYFIYGFLMFPPPAKALPLKIGDPAPDFSLEALWQAPADIKVNMENMRGKVIVLEFWATWCGPCRKTIPHFNKLVKEFAQRPVRFISITDEEEWKVRNFLKVTPILGWIGLDTDGSMFKAYGIKWIPQTVLIDQKGRVAAITSPGLVNSESIERLLKGETLNLPLKKVQAVSLEKKAKEEKKAEPPLLELWIRPARPSISMSISDKSFKARGMTLHNLTSIAYEISPVRLIDASPLANKTYEVKLNIKEKDRKKLLQLLRQSLKIAFGLKVHPEVREMEALVLTLPKEGKLSLRASESEMPILSDKGQITSEGTSISKFSKVLEETLGKIVLDETKLLGLYNIALYWDPDNPQSVIKAVQDQMGLEVRTEKRPIKVLILETDSMSNKG